MSKRPEFTIMDHEQCLGPDYGIPVLAFDTEEHFYLPLSYRIRGGLKKISREEPERVVLMFSFGRRTTLHVADEICLGINNFFTQNKETTISGVEIVVNDRRIQALIEERVVIN